MTYQFSNAVQVVSPVSTDEIAELLPSFVHVAEIAPGLSMLAVTVFDFTTSIIGAYRELVISVPVVPFAAPDGVFPMGALFPLVVATSTPQSKTHGHDHWHLPSWHETIECSITNDDQISDVQVSCNSIPVVSLKVHAHSFMATRQIYQSIMHDSTGRHAALMSLDGEASERQDGTGMLELGTHPLLGDLRNCSVEAIPATESWMRNGIQNIFQFDSI